MCFAVFECLKYRPSASAFFDLLLRYFIEKKRGGRNYTRFVLDVRFFQGLVEENTAHLPPCSLDLYSLFHKSCNQLTNRCEI